MQFRLPSDAQNARVFRIVVDADTVYSAVWGCGAYVLGVRRLVV